MAKTPGPEIGACERAGFASFMTAGTAANAGAGGASAGCEVG
jgi:hypothetical protein